MVAIVNTISMHIRFATVPALNKSLVVKYPDEYVIALPGVDITNMNASPPVSAMVSDASSGVIPAAGGIDSASGISIATAPMFDIMLVSNIVVSMSISIIM